MKQLAYIGGYTDETHKGIGIVEIDTAAKTLRKVGGIEGIDNPIYFAPTRKNLGALRRLVVAQAMPGTKPEDKATCGAIAVYDLGGDPLKPALLDVKPTGHTVPCHICLTQDETRIAFAEYRDGTYGTLAFDAASGKLGEPEIHTLTEASSHVVPARQDTRHAHCIIENVGGESFAITDLSADAVYIFAADNFDAPASKVDMPPGFGPRHILGIDENSFYVIGELANEIAKVENGKVVCRASLLPPGAENYSAGNDTPKSAAIRLSPDGRFVLGSVRDNSHSLITALCAKTLEYVASSAVGTFPRDFAFLPACADFVLVGHKLADELALYEFDASRGLFSRTDSINYYRALAIATL